MAPVTTQRLASGTPPSGYRLMRITNSNCTIRGNAPSRLSSLRSYHAHSPDVAAGWCGPDQPTSMDPSFPARPNPYLSGDWPPSVSSRPAFSRPLLDGPSLESRIRVLEGKGNKTLSRKPLDLTVAGGRRRTGNWRARSIGKGPSTRTVRVWLGRRGKGRKTKSKVVRPIEKTASR